MFEGKAFVLVRRKTRRELRLEQIMVLPADRALSPLHLLSTYCELTTRHIAKLPSDGEALLVLLNLASCFGMRILWQPKLLSTTTSKRRMVYYRRHVPSVS